MKFLFYFLIAIFTSYNALASSFLDNTLFANFIENLDTRKAIFKQEKIISELDLTFTSEGNIYFEKGKGVVFNQTQPEQITFTATKENYCIQKEKHALSELPHYKKISKLFDLILSERWETIENNFNIQYTQNNTTWHIEMNPNNNEISKFVQNIAFTGTVTDLTRIEINYTNGTKIILDLRPIQKDTTDEINC